MNSQQYVTTQRTAKKFKFQSLISLLLIVVGVIMAINAGGPEGNEQNLVWGCLIALFGFGWRIVNRVRIWWNHD